MRTGGAGCGGFEIGEGKGREGAWKKKREGWVVDVCRISHDGLPCRESTVADADMLDLVGGVVQISR